MNFTTFEEDGVYQGSGSMFVIALVGRDTLKLKGYVKEAFLTEDDAEEALNTSQTDNSIAYIIQEKPFTFTIHRTEE